MFIMSHILLLYLNCLMFLYMYFYAALSPTVSQWSQWSIWSACTATCGDGKRSRTRKCGNDLTEDNNHCPGSSLQVEPCILRHCPGKP